MQAFAGTFGTWVHAGLSPLTPNHNFTPGRQYGNDPNLADAAKRTVMAWYSNATGRLGVLAQDVNADGSPGAGPLTMPGTGAMNVGMLGRTPRSRVGAGRAPVIARFDNSPAVAIAAASDGRIWVLWTASATRTYSRGGRTRARRGSARP